MLLSPIRQYLFVYLRGPGASANTKNCRPNDERLMPLASHLLLSRAPTDCRHLHRDLPSALYKTRLVRNRSCAHDSRIDARELDQLPRFPLINGFFWNRLRG
jgi:hypothetical protein